MSSREYDSMTLSQQAQYISVGGNPDQPLMDELGLTSKDAVSELALQYWDEAEEGLGYSPLHCPRRSNTTMLLSTPVNFNNFTYDDAVPSNSSPYDGQIRTATVTVTGQGTQPWENIRSPFYYTQPIVRNHFGKAE